MKRNENPDGSSRTLPFLHLGQWPSQMRVRLGQTVREQRLADCMNAPDFEVDFVVSIFIVSQFQLKRNWSVNNILGIRAAIRDCLEKFFLFCLSPFVESLIYTFITSVVSHSPITSLSHTTFIFCHPGTSSCWIYSVFSRNNPNAVETSSGLLQSPPSLFELIWGLL